MKEFKPFLVLLVFVAFFGNACKKDTPVNPLDEQLAKEELVIKDFLTENNITAERHQSGLYYVIDTPGTGTVTYRANTLVKVKYTLRLLGGDVIPQTTEPVSLYLGEVILGWQIGVPLIQKGGKIRLFIPSIYAYGTSARNGIPPNSILDYEIELVDVTY